MVMHFLENNKGNKCGIAKEFDIQLKQVCDWNNNTVNSFYSEFRYNEFHNIINLQCRTDF